jgi:hypothetical protein
MFGRKQFGAMCLYLPFEKVKPGELARVSQPLAIGQNVVLMG